MVDHREEDLASQESKITVDGLCWLTVTHHMVGNIERPAPAMGACVFGILDTTPAHLMSHQMSSRDTVKHNLTGSLREVSPRCRGEIKKGCCRHDVVVVADGVRSLQGNGKWWQCIDLRR